MKPSRVRPILTTCFVVSQSEHDILIDVSEIIREALDTRFIRWHKHGV